MTTEKLHLAFIRAAVAFTTEHVQALAWFLINLQRTSDMAFRVAGSVADAAVQAGEILFRIAAGG